MTIVHLLATCCLVLIMTRVSTTLCDIMPLQNTSVVADQENKQQVTATPSDQSATLNATIEPTMELISTNVTTEQQQQSDQNATLSATVEPTMELITTNVTTDQQQPSDQNTTINATVEPTLDTTIAADIGNGTADQQQQAQSVNVVPPPSDPNAPLNATMADQPREMIINGTDQQQQAQAANVVPAPSDQNAAMNATNTEQAAELIADGGVNGTDQHRADEEAGLSGLKSEVAGGELGGHEANVPLASSGGLVADGQNAKNDSTSSSASSDVSSGKVVDTTKFIAHNDSDCWTDQNGDDTPRWISSGEQVERGIVWYECQDGKLVTIGCTDENGKRLALNGTYQSGRYRMKCVPFGDNARRQVIGCVPDGQLDKTYLPGESWVDNEKQIWWQCVLENAWLGGCYDASSNKTLNVGDAIDTNLTTYECQHKHFDAFRMVPVGCIFDGTRYNVGLYWQDDEFVFYCKLQRDDAGADSASTTCIDCILRNQRLFDEEHVFQNEHAVKCAKRLEPEGYTLCAAR